jgi:methylmalonyl-CoA/ethylmalonyl-CoA epimerase
MRPPGPVFTGADHLGIVTRNLDGALRRWSDQYGVGPWQVFEYDEASMEATYCGVTAAYPMLAALCSLDDGFRLELIQPLTPEGPYHDSLLVHDDADHLHHVRLATALPADAQAALVGSGNEVVFDAAFAGADPDGARFRARYYDTTGELGFLLEVGDPPDGFRMPEPRNAYPPVS